jgi:hypothetical protein
MWGSKCRGGREGERRRRESTSRVREREIEWERVQNARVVWKESREEMERVGKKEIVRVVEKVSRSER